MPQPIATRQIIKAVEVDRMCGLSGSTRERMESKGEFPRRVCLTERRIGYYSDEIAAWINSRPRGEPLRTW